MLFAVAVLAAGCGQLLGPISRDRAIDLAVGHSGLQAPFVREVAEKTLAELGFEPPTDRDGDPDGRVWVIRISGVQRICGPAGSPVCQTQDAIASVLLDYRSGALIDLTYERERP